MTSQHEVYKCPVCGNVVEVLWAGGGQLVCCNQPMNRQKDNFLDQGQEKHIPVVETLSDQSGVRVKVGSVEHPMTPEHYIEWVEIITEDQQRYKKFFQPTDHPVAEFLTKSKVIQAKAYCNIHGLWQSQ